MYVCRTTIGSDMLENNAREDGVRMRDDGHNVYMMATGFRMLEHLVRRRQERILYIKTTMIA